MVGALTGREDVGMAWCQREVCPAVLQREATALRDDAGAEAAVVAVDEGHAVAFLVCHGEVDRVAVVVSGAAVVDDVTSLIRIEELCAFGEVSAGN